MISDKTKETDLLVGPTVHERYDLRLFTLDKKNTVNRLKFTIVIASPFRMYFGAYFNVRQNEFQ